MFYTPRDQSALLLERWKQKLKALIYAKYEMSYWHHEFLIAWHTEDAMIKQATSILYANPRLSFMYAVSSTWPTLTMWMIHSFWLAHFHFVCSLSACAYMRICNICHVIDVLPCSVKRWHTVYRRQFGHRFLDKAFHSPRRFRLLQNSYFMSAKEFESHELAE